MPANPFSLWDRVTLARVMKHESRALVAECKFQNRYGWRGFLQLRVRSPLGLRRTRWGLLLGWVLVVLYASAIIQSFDSHASEAAVRILTIVVFVVSGWFLWHFENPLLLPVRRRRVRTLNQAVRSWRGRWSPPGPDEAWRSVAGEYTDRCAQWHEERLGNPVPWRSTFGARTSFVTLDRRALLASYGGLIVMFGSPIVSPLLGLRVMSPLVMFAGVAFFWTGLFYSRGRLAKACQRLGACLLNRHCPDCDYPLADVTPAADPTALGGINLGPIRCPECGSPWPLLPPPITPG